MLFLGVLHRLALPAELLRGVRCAFGPRLPAVSFGGPLLPLQTLASPAAQEVQAAIEEDCGDDEEQDAAGEPDAQRQFFLGVVRRCRVLFQRVKNSALVTGGICGLAGHAHDVCC